MDSPPEGFLDSLIATATTIWKAFVIPLGLSGWVVYKWITGRNDNEAQRKDDRDMRRQAYIDSQRDIIDKAKDDQITALRAEGDRLRQMLSTSNVESQRNWTYARYYFVLAGELASIVRWFRHALANARQIANNLAVGRLKLDHEPDWERPPDAPRVGERLEDIQPPPAP